MYVSLFEKKTAGWKGIRGDAIPSEPGVYKYSIRIDNCNVNCQINLGYCLSTQSGSSGYYNSQCLSMIYLNSGLIYCPTLGNLTMAFRGTQGMVITCVIDSNYKFIVYFVNGKQIMHPRSFTMEIDDVGKICPCVDLNTVNDKFTIVEY